MLLLAIVGLTLSSFALLVLQSTMGGLQKKLIGRAKNIQGTAVLSLKRDISTNSSQINEIENYLKSQRILFTKEYELELLLKYKNYLTPVIVHGVDPKTYLPAEFKNPSDKLLPDFNGIVIPMELAYKVGVLAGDEVQLISPLHVDSFLTDVPRLITAEILTTVNFDVPEVDGFELWIKLSKIQNLVREKSFNSFRFYSPITKKQSIVLKKFGIFKTWEEKNSSLVYALNLESTIMIFLFGAMSLLVSFCIFTGLLVFFNKIRLDLSSFWILGMSRKQITKSTGVLLVVMIIGSIVLGLILGTGFLVLLKTYGAEILPDVFIDRKIPVYFSLKNYLVSFFLPFIISVIFISISFKRFKDQDEYLHLLRSVTN